MKDRLIGLAILIAVVGSAAFQMVLLIVAGFSGIEVVGVASLSQSIAVLLCSVLLSDLKSLSIRALVNDQSLRPLCEVRNSLLLVIAGICVFLMQWQIGRIFALLLIIKASAQAADINMSVWQKKRRPDLIIKFCFLRYGGVSFALVASHIFFDSFQDGLLAAAIFSVLILLLEQTLVNRLALETEISWELCKIKNISDRSFITTYTSLALAAGLNFAPQTIIRYFISLYGGMRLLGSFSIQYQITMLCIPIVTALSQQALSRRDVTLHQIYQDLRFIGIISCTLLISVGILFNTPADVILRFAFQSWIPLPVPTSLLIIISSVFLCFTVYLGFMSVALKKAYAQSLANVIFLTSIFVFSPTFGHFFGVIGVLFGFTIATAIRLILLFTIVRRAAMNEVAPLS